jgi:formate dehydrogenase subunit gamma
MPRAASSAASAVVTWLGWIRQNCAARDNSVGLTDADTIVRFRRSERHLHWAIAVPFLICLATAAVLVLVYNPNPTRPLRSLVSWVHRLSGCCLAVLPTWVAVRHRGDLGLFWRNVSGAWSWTVADLKWLMLMGPSTFDKRIELPHQDKFNAAEKINFMVLTATWPIYVATGLLIWLPGVAYLSWIVHLSMATAALPLIGGHVFMATVNPDTRVGLSGMITGHVDRHWARHHYRRWYDEHFGHTHDDVGVVGAGGAAHTPAALSSPVTLASPRAAAAAITETVPSPCETAG